MSVLVSVRLNDGLVQEMKSKAHVLHLSQTDYIREAIKHMNAETEKQERKQRLKQASLRVRKESMKVSEEFSRIEHDPET